MDLTDVIGPTGRHQWKTLAIVSLRPVAAAFTIFLAQFSLTQVDHWCSPPEQYSNLSTESWKECCIPKSGSVDKYSKCEYFEVEPDGLVSNNTLFCDRWTFDTNVEYKSVRMEYNLVCSRGWYVSLVYMSFSLGNLVAYIPAGQIADKYGRKPISLVGAAANVFVGILTFFSNSVEWLITSRFLAGFAFGMYQNTILCLFTEVMGPEYRDYIILPFNGVFGLAMMAMSGLAYLITDWRYLAIVSSFPVNLPLFILIWKFIPESSRWLLAVKRYDEAEKQITMQVKENGLKIEDMNYVMGELKKKVEQDKELQGRFNFFDLLRNRHLLRLTLVVYISFFITVAVYHGFQITVGQLGGLFHLNFFLGGLVELVSVAVLFLFIRKFSRRMCLLGSMVLAGGFFLLTIPVNEDLNWLRVLLAMLGRMCNAATFTLLLLFSFELFPTSLRTVGVSGGMGAGRIGSFLASFTDDIGRIYGRTVILGMYGGLCLISSVIFLLLPETSHLHLPDTVTETEKLSKTVKLGRETSIELSSKRESQNVNQ